MNSLPGNLVDDGVGRSQPSGWRFRVVHLLYVIAVVASSLATFGAGGILPALIITAFWTAVFTSRSRPKAFRMALVVLLLFGCLTCLMLPAIQTAREAARRVMCFNNLKNIGLALQNYHDTYGSFPPAYVPDENGRPMHSWRVLILPFLEYRNLYDKYDFSEPWDGPNNSKLLSKMPDAYACPAEANRKAAANHLTSYVAVVDPRSVWPGATSTTLKQIVDADGTANTIIILEAGGAKIPWMKPDDVGLTEAIRCLSSADGDATGGHRSEDFFYVYETGYNVSMVDGSVHFLFGGIDPDYLRGLLVVDDGRGRDEVTAESQYEHVQRPKWGNWFRLAVFVLIAVFPTPWVWLNPSPTTADHERAPAQSTK